MKKNVRNFVQNVCFILLGLAIGHVLLAHGIPAFAATNTTGSTPGTAIFNVQFINPLNASTVCGLLRGILNVTIQLAIPIIILFIVYAGFRLVFAQGNAEALKAARANLVVTLIGIGIFLGAWTLASVLTNTINQLQPGSINACQ